MNPTIIWIVAIGAIFAFSLLVSAYRSGQRTKQSCADCGLPSSFGYSPRAESEWKNITRVCSSCLKKRLAKDYREFTAQALVVEPASGLPCYVFQPSTTWADTKLATETSGLLSRMERVCSHCGAAANLLWVGSTGLSVENFEKLFEDGIAETLLKWGNLAPRPLCAQCCVDQIFKAVEARHCVFLEVCGPRAQDGFVLPMGY